VTLVDDRCHPFEPPRRCGPATPGVPRFAVDRLFRWIEQFDSHLDWQRDDPFFELESATDWTEGDSGIRQSIDGLGADERAVA
jgi:hypothetical protein